LFDDDAEKSHQLYVLCVKTDERPSIGEDTTFVDYQTNLVRLAKQIARTAQEMVGTLFMIWTTSWVFSSQLGVCTMHIVLFCFVYCRQCCASQGFPFFGFLLWDCVFVCYCRHAPCWNHGQVL